MKKCVKLVINKKMSWNISHVPSDNFKIHPNKLMSQNTPRPSIWSILICGKEYKGKSLLIVHVFCYLQNSGKLWLK